MSTTTHNFQIGQRVVFRGHLRERARPAGTYMGDMRDGRLMVRLDANGCTYPFGADRLEPEARAITVTLTEPEAKLVRMALAGLMRSESGTTHELMGRALEKIDHALPHSEA